MLERLILQGRPDDEFLLPERTFILNAKNLGITGDELLQAAIDFIAAYSAKRQINKENAEEVLNFVKEKIQDENKLQGLKLMVDNFEHLQQISKQRLQIPN